MGHRGHIPGGYVRGELSLERRYLRGSDLRGSDLRHVKLWGSDLSGSDLRGSDFSEGDLQGTDLRGTKLKGTYLWGTDLYGILIDKKNIDNLLKGMGIQVIRPSKTQLEIEELMDTKDTIQNTKITVN